MAVPCVFLLTVLGAEVTSKSSDSLESDAECCMDAMEANSTCLADTQCTPGCYRRWNEDGSSSCVKCENNKTLPAAPVYNLTDCQNDAAREFSPVSNITTVTPETLGVGSIVQSAESVSMDPSLAVSGILQSFPRQEGS
ncbi:hypothetical protein Chor_010708 [Crotalus horridus]